ncbi:hypothetical protein LX87_01838 [Larkinella arboricola]|uniref:Uncharacterized protein n=1 Tax=Larkinella arboricola TaxID=643671 RepID=A0A327X1Y9_LARAB|nr:hypothetical protein LX87_01838 [Larkinella arboricola]
MYGAGCKSNTLYFAVAKMKNCIIEMRLNFFLFITAVFLASLP